jgi:hypothetical protein
VRGGDGRHRPRSLRLRGRPDGRGRRVRLVRRARGPRRVQRARRSGGARRPRSPRARGGPAAPGRARPPGPRLVQRQPQRPGRRRPQRVARRHDPRDPAGGHLPSPARGDRLRQAGDHRGVRAQRRAGAALDRRRRPAGEEPAADADLRRRARPRDRPGGERPGACARIGHARRRRGWRLPRHRRSGRAHGGPQRRRVPTGPGERASVRPALRRLPHAPRPVRSLRAGRARRRDEAAARAAGAHVDQRPHRPPHALRAPAHAVPSRPALGRDRHGLHEPAPGRARRPRGRLPPHAPAQRTQGDRRPLVGPRRAGAARPWARVAHAWSELQAAQGRPLRRQHAQRGRHRGRQGRGAGAPRRDGRRLRRGRPGGARDDVGESRRRRPDRRLRRGVRRRARAPAGRRAPRFAAPRGARRARPARVPGRGRLRAFTTTFEDLHGLRSCPASPCSG